MIISSAMIEQHYATLNGMGALGDQLECGFNRAAYSDEESDVMHYFADQADQYGLVSRWDGVGNLFIETAGDYQQWFECGSHVDTVPAGGNFDGLAGVVAGFTAISMLAQQPHQHGMRLRIWRGEESASFGITSIGCHAAFAQLPVSALNNRHAGISLQEAMRQQGADPTFIEQARATIDQHELDQISAHIELHIEQGAVLEKSGVDIGVVSGIRASSRYWIILRGAFDHSGATPMGREFRRDANLAMAHIMVELDSLYQNHLQIQPDIDLVQTIGHINSNDDINSQHPELHHNAISKVSGFAYFSFELRSCDDQLRQRYNNKAQIIIQDIANSFSVSAQIHKISESRGVINLPQWIQSRTQSICNTLHYNQLTLPSGAWHDAALMAQQQRSDQCPVPVGMVFIPCKDGKSHSPDEFSSYEQIAKGTSVLASLLHTPLS